MEWRAYEHTACLRSAPLLGQAMIFQGLNLSLVIRGDLQPSAAELRSHPASSCACTSVCVDRVISLSPHPLLCILVTLPSLLRHIVPPFMSVAATLTQAVITQRQRSYLKTQYDGATIKPSSIIARGLKCHCFITHYMVVCQDLSTVLYGFKTRKGKITTDNTCCSSRQ